MSEQEQIRELTPAQKPAQKQGDSRLQELYNRRRDAQRAVREIDRLIAEEKNRLKATSAQS
jgi:hypothetical protein